MAFGSNHPLDKDEVSGTWVLNFAQQQRFSDSVFVGLLRSEDPKRGDHVNYKFHSAGAKTQEQSKQIHKASVHQDNVYSFSAGEVDPRPVKMIFPQGIMDYRKLFAGSEMPDSPDLGAVLGKMVYTQQDMIRMMKNYAQEKPKEIRKMQDMYKDMDLTSQENMRRVNRVIDQVMNAGSSSGKKNSRRSRL